MTVQVTEVTLQLQISFTFPNDVLSTFFQDFLDNSVFCKAT